MRIFVGNLSDRTVENDLRQVFESFGEVKSITMATDPAKRTSRGFAFVIMPVAYEARDAIEKANGRDLQGRKIDVAKSRTSTKPHASTRRPDRPRKAGKRAGRRSKRRRR